MSNLDRLIDELCPEGVEYLPLGKLTEQVFERNFGQQISEVRSVINSSVLVPSEEYFNKKVTSNDTSNYKIVQNGMFVYNPSRINIGSIAYSHEVSPIIVSPMYVVFKIDTERLFGRFLNMFLQSHSGVFQINGMTEEGARFRFPYEYLGRIVIPLPPLPVQQEIVRILDKFTALEAELEAELEARKKQYEYYRKLLLNFDGQRDVPYKWMALGEVGRVSMCKRIMKAVTSPDGDVPFFKIGTFGREPDAYISQEKYDEYRKAYSFPKKGDVLISAAGTIGRTVIYDGEPAYYQDSNIVWIDNDESEVLNKYLNYCYSMKPWAVSNGGTIARLYNDNINKAKIPVPSLEEQERIVAILDRFDTLCNDLTSGLPAEIEARRKQYEYYRDKLLTFKEAQP